MPEERKVLWKVATIVMTALAALFIAKAGIPAIDFPCALLCALASTAVVESQRNLGKFSLGFRKGLLRAATRLASGIPAALAGGLFLSAVASMARGAADSFAQQPSQGHALADARDAVVAGLVLLAASLRVFRGLQFRALMIDEPRKAAFSLIVKRRFVARCDAECFLFEAGVMIVSLCCASSLAGLAKMLFKALAP